MAKQSYLLRRSATYYFRISVPIELRQRFGKPELVKSLNTTFLYEAKELCSSMALVTKEIFRTVESMPDLTTAEIQQITQRYYQECIERFEAWMQQTRTGDRFKLIPGTEYEPHPDAPTLEDVTDNILKPFENRSATDPLFDISDHIISTQRLTVGKSTPAYKELARMGALQVQEAIQQLCQQYVHHQPLAHKSDWLQYPPEQEANQQTALPPLQFSEAIQKYQQQDTSGTSSKTTKTATFALWQELMGDKPLADITKHDAVTFKENLLKLPKNMRKRKPYRDMDIQKILEFNVPETERQSVKTVNEKLLSMQTLFTWAVNNAYYEGDNPFQGLQINGSSSQVTPIKPYKLEHLQKIFSSPVYRGSRNSHHRYAAGTTVIEDGLFWVPLIALLSGARMNEICQLDTNDIYEQEGIWLIDINTNGTHKKLKNHHSARKVPLHQKLIELGLLDYQQRATTEGHSKLFPELPLCSKRQNYANIFSKRYATWMKTLELHGGGLVFHSFRHTFITKLRELNTNQIIIDSLAGHNEGSARSNYGQTTLNAMQEAINTVAFDLPWDNIKPTRDTNDDCHPPH